MDGKLGEERLEERKEEAGGTGGISFEMAIFSIVEYDNRDGDNYDECSRDDDSHGCVLFANLKDNFCILPCYQQCVDYLPWDVLLSIALLDRALLLGWRCRMVIGVLTMLFCMTQNAAPEAFELLARTSEERFLRLRG